MRDLASIATIEKTWALEGKDRVVGASMVENAYECMVSKDIQPGQLVAFIQEGAILPVCDTWEWLRKRCYRENVNGFVIKPQKFGCIKSWGLIVPLTDLGLEGKVVSKLKAGDDITDLLGIRKYEPEEDASPKGDSKKSYPKWVKFCLSHSLTRWIGRIWQAKHQNVAGGFPSDVISKSDETTVQNKKDVITRFADDLVYTSCKIEGQSFTALFDYKNGKVGKFYVCSRNSAYRKPSDTVLFWTVAKRLDVENKLAKFYKDTGKLLVIQGEQVGPGIQQNIYDLPVNDWYVYTIKDEITGKQLPLDEMVSACETLGLKTVPIIEKNVKLSSIMPDVDTAVTYAENKFWVPTKDGFEPFYTEKKGKLWVDYFQHEGVVVRSMNYDKDSNVGVSFKVKNLAYAEQDLGKTHNACVAVKSKL